jgi:ribulose-5-phosphate 4-epimerase/fuculose-1-phosphate aldolase
MDGVTIDPQNPNTSQWSEEEWRLRVELAACYRTIARLGWGELIFNHITLRLPGPDVRFLINAFGLLPQEVTASSLVKIDLDGNVVEPSPWPVNQAGFVIHSAIHAARPDAHCVMHTHTTAGMAVAQQRDGLIPGNFYSGLLYSRVGYHDFEGSVVYDAEKPRLVASLGRCNLLILRNHGLIACGPTVGQTFFQMWLLQRACEAQIAAQSTGVPLIPIPEAVLGAHAGAVKQTIKDGDGDDMPALAKAVFAAMVRELDRVDRSYAT